MRGDRFSTAVRHVRRARERRGEESGFALIAVLLVLMIVSSLVVVTIAVSVHSNSATQDDRHRENAFGAATAGVDDALRCLQQLLPANPVTNCSFSAGAGTQLADGGTNIGQYSVTVQDLTPGAATKSVVITAQGWGPTSTAPSAVRSLRTITTNVTLIPTGGFADTIFAGGASPNGTVSFKNNASVSGAVYARAYDEQKNSDSILDLRVLGDVVTKNNDVYRSIWAGGSVTVGSNTTVQTSVQACGAGALAGDASLLNGSIVAGNLRYKGTYNGGGSAGSLTHAGCSAPPILSLPTFTFNVGNYPGWTVLNFSTATLGNSCLATAGSSQLAQIAACGAALGDADGTVGKNMSGTVVYINDPSCLTPVLMNSATFTGNFTIVTNCKLQPEGTFTKSPLAIGNKQAVFISTSSTGVDDLSGAPTTTDPSLSVLFYTTGELSTKGSLTLASGALYGASINGKNSVTVTGSPDLANNAPPGFAFATAVALRYTPIVTLWRES